MQTVRSLAERLDMSADEAVAKLQFMLFEVDGPEAQLTDEQCDLLIDADDDEDLAAEVRAKRLKEQEKEEKRKNRLREAGKKAAAKRKAEAKKKAAKKKPAAKKKKAAAKKKAAKPQEEPAEAPEQAPEAPAEAPAQEPPAAEETVAVEAPAKPETEVAAPPEPSPAEAVAEEEPPAPAPEVSERTPEPEEPVVSEPEPEEPEPAAEAPEAEAVAPRAEILPAEEPAAPDEAPEESASAEEQTPEEEDGQSVVNLIASRAPKQDEPAGEPAPESTEAAPPVAEIEPPKEETPAEPELPTPSRPAPAPDPEVVAEVQRKAAERLARKRAAEGFGGDMPPAHGRGPAPARTEAAGRTQKSAPSKPTGKTARKRAKKAERMRADEDMRREAAAAIKEIQAAGTKKKKRRQRDDGSGGPVGPTIIEVDEAITVEELANALDLGTNDLILELMDLEIMATKNQPLDIEIVRRVAEPKGAEVRAAIPEEEQVMADIEDEPEDLMQRAPVVTVMGHVDHGKTTLLDRVRSANVAEGEAGGITQHIAAYEAQVGENRVVFLDTPGHEAFTQMRMRGAQATDVVVLVVAADDGVMPQTIEAIDHARAAEVPIVVAINKCDKPDAQPDRIRTELSHHGLVCEEWGGDIQMVQLSAKSGEGVQDLMELLALEAEMLDLKANPGKRARGVVVESEISRGQGPVAWVLVQEGTLHTGDVYLAGKTYGRVRSMHNSRGVIVEEAGPATPVAVTGFSEPPEAGEELVAVAEERIARGIAAKRAEIAKQRADRAARRVTLEDFQAQLQAGEHRTLYMVIKADVQGSVDVLNTSFAKLGNEEVSIQVVHSGVGGINESDVLLASASEAIIIGFHVTANARVQKLAETEGVEIRTYRVIYEAIDEVRQALEGMLAPESKEVVEGHAEIRQVFRSSSIGNIAGCYVTDGEITRTSRLRVVRDDVVVHEGTLGSLRRGTDDARTVQTGYECGIKVQNFDDVKEGDVIEAFRMEEVRKTLE